MSILKDQVVLVVDDETDLREMLVYELQNIGAKTLEAKNGKDAIGIVKNDKIDLIISDVRMPGGNGIEFLDETKKIDLNKPVFVFITAYSDNSREELHAHGVEGLFAKPFDLLNLLNSIEWFILPPNERYAVKPKDIAIEENIFILNEESAAQFQIGRGGALIPTGTTLLNAGAYIQFQIIFKSGEEISGIGEIIWNGAMNHNGEYCAGLEFKYFTDNTRAFAIKTLLNNKCLEYIPQRATKID
ncbi:response regulator [Fluviispira multicolorata]|uniref:Response regulator n=1 Tax=Fluviispira multicolorata TaxID=2654512 RepID=A0A833JEG1_9BACT|nr:response regulator [Fluviispira multicolorata]KAB8031879.1 response regulator [Fluviispira multicolorata]